MRISSTGCFFFYYWSRGSCLRARGCSHSNGGLSGTLRLPSVWLGQRWLLGCVSHTFLASGESWLSRWFTGGWQESIHHCRATKREGHGRSSFVQQRSRFILFVVSSQLHKEHIRLYLCGHSVCFGFCFFLWFFSLCFSRDELRELETS